MSENTLMTDAQTNTSSAPDSTNAAAATTNVDTSAPANVGAANTATDANTNVDANAANGQQAATDGKTSEPTGNTDGKTDGTEGNQDGKTDTKPNAPEKYEFKAPENTTLDDAVLGKLSEVAKELDLSQEAAQKLVDKVAPEMAKRQVEAFQKLNETWVTEVKADKELGGDKLQENLAVAKKGLDAVGSPALRALLEQTGLGNQPEVIRAFYKVGQFISQDRFVPGGTGAPKGSGDAAKSLYPNQQT